MSPPAGIAVVLVALGALLLGARALQARGAVGAEAARKLVHLGMGCISLAFPLLFSAAWPVWTLAGLAGAALCALRFVPVLRRNLGGVLHDVDRASLGEVYFPLGVAAVFTLSDGEVLRFIVPIALLTFADAAGALIGKRWGRHHFETLEGRKSLEGSLAVGGVGFLCVAGPLLAAGHETNAALLAGAVMGLFALILEAIAWRGMDNIFLPLAAYAQISVFLAAPIPSLAARLAVLTGLLCVGVVWRRGQVVDTSARLGAALALYLFWAVGGWEWLVAPVVLVASYVRLMPSMPRGMPRHNLVAVICMGSVGLLWCVAQAFAPATGLVAPFSLGLATHQAVIAIVRFSQGKPHWPRLAWWAAGLAQAAATQGLAFALVDQEGIASLVRVAAGVACGAGATAGFILWERQLQAPDDLGARWWKQGAAAVVASLAGFVLMYP